MARKPLQHRPLTVNSVGSELVDAYDADGRLIGVKERAAVHRDGTWHRCFHCLILLGGDASPRVVLQRRARVVVDYPGLLDVTVAGHLLAGETVLEAAAREISEELGVELPTQSLEPLGEYRLIVETPGIWAREITDVFITHDERSPDAYRCNPVEVASVLTLPLTDAVKLWSGERSYATVREFEGGRSVLRDVALRDFVNEVPEYWPWLAAALDLATAR